MKHSILALALGLMATSNPLIGQQVIESTFGKGVTVVAADESFLDEISMHVSKACSSPKYRAWISMRWRPTG
jgi:hypothetical protein